MTYLSPFHLRWRTEPWQGETNRIIIAAPCRFIAIDAGSWPQSAAATMTRILLLVRMQSVAGGTDNATWRQGCDLGKWGCNASMAYFSEWPGLVFTCNLQLVVGMWKISNSSYHFGIGARFRLNNSPIVMLLSVTCAGWFMCRRDGVWFLMSSSREHKPIYRMSSFRFWFEWGHT